MENTEEIMLQIDDTLISSDVLEKKFICDLSKCKGACCIEGDSGAPLTPEEQDVIEKNMPIISKYITPEGRKAIEAQGVWFIDQEGDTVTTLIEGAQCAFTVFDGDVAKCGIEKAWIDGAIKFRKPISCHLYPIREQKYDTFTAVNYDTWDICEDALIMGEKKGVPMYVFLKEPLIRKHGKEWYEQLEQAAKIYKEQNNSW